MFESIIEIRNEESSQAESAIMRPRNLADATEIGSHLRHGRQCIVDLTGMDMEVAQRIADFLGGVCSGIGGSTTRINNGIFVVSPKSHKVSPFNYNEAEPFYYSSMTSMKRASGD